MRGLLLVNMNYYDEIKNELINNEINRKVKNYSINRSDLNTYYNVGKMLSESGKCYGEVIIIEYSLKLTRELGKGYNVSSLKRMRQFYFVIKKGATLSHQLTWSHYQELLPYNMDKINYYVYLIEKQNLSIRKLRYKMKSNEYERLSEDVKNKLIDDDKLSVVDLIKNPVKIRNNGNYERGSLLLNMK